LSVLVVLAQPPVAEGNATSRCAVGLLRGLAAHGVDVRAVAARQHWSPAGEPPPDLDVDVVEVAPEGSSLRERLVAYREPVSELARGPFAARVRELARAADVVHLEGIETAGLARVLPGPTVVHLHYLVRRDRSLGAPWTREFRDVLQFARAEHSALRRATRLVASSPVVAAALGPGVTVAPLSLDGSLYPPAPLDGPPVAGLLGSAAWPPTRNAVERLLARVWPLVRQARPEATLRLAGRGMAELVPSAPGVEVVGEVESASEFLRGLSLLLYPLGRGSGMKVKVLESIASGLPVVTTRHGAEGIDAGDGAVVDEDDARLAAAASELLADAGARRERGRAARARFEERYAPFPATAPLISVYRSV
jgi:glycosyltransferase involved in cell wall biosynthesis